MSDLSPITVSATPAPVQIAAALRSLIVALGPLGGFLGHAGWFGDASPLLQYVMPIAAIIAFVWGQYATRKHAVQAASMAAQLPNAVAQFK